MRHVCCHILTLFLWLSADPPAVEPVSLEVRQGLSRPVPMTCRVLRAHPSRVLRYEWRLGSRLLHAGHFDTSDETEYSVRSLSRDGYGEYTCDVINEAGAGRCTFLVTGKSTFLSLSWVIHELKLYHVFDGLCQCMGESISAYST